MPDYDYQDAYDAAERYAEREAQRADDAWSDGVRIHHNMPPIPDKPRHYGPSPHLDRALAQIGRAYADAYPNRKGAK
jgi:hypothetical protein